MAVTGYAAQGTIPNATTGAQVRVAIVSSTNASPIVVQATAHGFNTGDSIEIEGHATNTAANGQWQITKTDANHFSLNGSTGNGVGGATGYAIHDPSQPALQIPSPSDPASMVTLGPILEGNANPAPYLYRRLGKWRLYNQYVVLKGTAAPPYASSPWSTNTNLTTGGPFTALASAQWSLQSLCDTTGIAPYSGANELWEFSLSFSAFWGATVSGATVYANIGACITSGTTPGFLGVPMAIAEVGALTAEGGPSIITPITLSGALETSFNVSNLYLTLAYYLDYVSSGNVDINLIGPLTGYLNQYRQN